MLKIDSSLEATLAKTRGVFAGISVDLKSKTTCIYTDKLGIRPLFVYKTVDVFYFSSLLGLFEEVFPKKLSSDFAALKEILTFNHALDNRTCYKEITRMMPSEFITIKKGMVKSGKYWDWTKLEISTQTEADLAKELKQTFANAIDVRLGPSKTANTFLSGGMDSRIVTASLRMKNIEVASFNFQTRDCQDTVFSSLYAQNAGINLTLKRVGKSDFYGWSRLISRELPTNQPKVVWSGDGGAVIGGVYLTEKIADLCTSKSYKASVQEFMDIKKAYYNSRYFKGELAGDNIYEPIDRVLKNLRNFPADKAKALSHFIMANNQARSLTGHFETLAQHKVELILPFFDAHFVEWVYKIPTQKLLNHKIYDRWFKLFPDFVKKTPWQTYPGHIKCDVKFNTGVLTQWHKDAPSLSQRWNFCCEVLLFMKSEYVKAHVSRYKVYSALFLHLCGLTDLSFLKRYMSILKSSRVK